MQRCRRHDRFMSFFFFLFSLVLLIAYLLFFVFLLCSRLSITIMCTRATYLSRFLSAIVLSPFNNGKSTFPVLTLLSSSSWAVCIEHWINSEQTKVLGSLLIHTGSSKVGGHNATGQRKWPILRCPGVTLTVCLAG